MVHDQISYNHSTMIRHHKKITGNPGRFMQGYRKNARIWGVDGGETAAHTPKTIFEVTWQQLLVTSEKVRLDNG